MEIVSIFGRILLGVVFVLSAVPKLLAPGQTIRDVQNYRILPGLPAKGFGMILPYAELGAGTSMLFGYQVQWAAILILVLLASFIAAVGIAMARHQNLTCTCFGLLYRERVGWKTQARDGVLSMITLVTFLSVGTETTTSTTSALGSASLFGAVASGLSVSALLAALFLGWVAAKGWPRWVLQLVRTSVP